MEEKINIIKDLKEIKKVELKDRFWVIIKKWVYQNKKNRKEFRDEFLSNNADKYFDELKDLVGEFEELEKEVKGISVLDFLFYIICGYDSNKFFKEMNKEFKTLKEKWLNEYNKTKQRG